MRVPFLVNCERCNPWMEKIFVIFPLFMGHNNFPELVGLWSPSFTFGLLYNNSFSEKEEWVCENEIILHVINHSN